MVETPQIDSIENSVIPVDYVGPLEGIGSSELQGWLKAELSEGINGITTYIDVESRDDQEDIKVLKNELSRRYKRYFGIVRGVGLLIRGYATTNRSTKNDGLDNIIRDARKWRSPLIQSPSAIKDVLNDLKSNDINLEASDIENLNTTVLKVIRKLGSYMTEDDLTKEPPVTLNERGLGATAHFMNYALEIIGYAYKAGSDLRDNHRSLLNHQKIGSQMELLASQLEWVREIFHQDPDNQSKLLKEVMLKVSRAVRDTIRLPPDTAT